MMHPTPADYAAGAGTAPLDGPWLPAQHPGPDALAPAKGLAAAGLVCCALWGGIFMMARAFF